MAARALIYAKMNRMPKLTSSHGIRFNWTTNSSAQEQVILSYFNLNQPTPISHREAKLWRKLNDAVVASSFPPCHCFDQILGRRETSFLRSRSQPHHFTFTVDRPIVLKFAKESIIHSEQRNLKMFCQDQDAASPSWQLTLSLILDHSNVNWGEHEFSLFQCILV